MKLYVTPHHGAIHLPAMAHSAVSVRSSLGQMARKFGKGVSNFVTQMQIARMQAVLYEMTDVQLANIDLKRSDIRQHAENLVSGKNDTAAPDEYIGL